MFDPGPKTTAIQLEDDKAGQIIEAHAETVDALKQHVAEAGKGVEDAEALRKQVEQLKADLAKAQEAGDADGMRAKCEEEHKAFEFDPGPKTDRHSTGASDTRSHRAVR